MQPLSLSELEREIMVLQGEINRLKPPTDKQGPNIDIRPMLQAGSYLWVRPYNFTKMVRRLGQDNVAIVDNEKTRGFCRGKDNIAQKWTNRVYPLDIGPSCDGIDSNTARVPATVPNESLTSKLWMPLKLFESSSSFELQGASGTLITTSCVALKHRNNENEETSWGYMAMRSPQFFYGLMKNPADYGNEYFENQDMNPIQQFFMFSNSTYLWSKPGTGGIIDNPNFHGYNLLELMQYLESKGQTLQDFSISIGNDKVGYYKYYPFFPFNGWTLIDRSISTGYWAVTAPRADAAVPHNISVFKIHTNNLRDIQPTPKITYGGYSRTNPPGIGPTVIWPRFCLLQIKILNDIPMEIRDDQVVIGSETEDGNISRFARRSRHASSRA